MVPVIASYWQIFRLIFVIFFLFLTGDALYRWDGFSYYGDIFRVPAFSCPCINRLGD